MGYVNRESATEVMRQARSKVVAAFGRKPLNFPHPQRFGGNLRAALVKIKSGARNVTVLECGGLPPLSQSGSMLPHSKWAAVREG